MKKWLNANPGLLIVSGFALFLLMYMWSWMPAPYSWTYWAKRALFTPQFVCRDGVYSWAKGGGGTCSSHGGVMRKYQ